MDSEESVRDLLESMLLDANVAPTYIPLSLLKSITNNFSNDRRIGVGGFAEVFKGQLQNGAVAVKKLNQTLDVHEMKFHQEIDSLLRVKHKNIVRFLGHCSDTQGKVWKLGGKNVIAEERQRFLCFEFLPKGSLDNYISDASQGLEWMTRFQIIKGVCQGLHYLHQQKIVHLDLKPANILLDHHKVPKIADFGLSKCFDEKQTRAMTSKVFGSQGYMAPECYGGLITFKSDIYSLGIVIIEILTGQKGYPEIENVLQSWTARFGTSQGDRRLEPVRICAEIGIECTEFNPTKRPVTQHIIERLAEMECTYGFIKSDLFISPSESTGSDEVKLEEGGNFFANDKPEMEDNKFDKGTGPKRFIYGELATATANFSDEHKIGESGFGSVYRGFLNEPPLAVAIKRVSKSSKQGRKEYTSEMLIVSRLRHRNIARLIGCCEDGGELLLVYELMPNGSLDEHLHSANASPMSWPHRHKVVMGLGSALLYLHEEWEQCLVHGNITPSNVMLDASFNAKLGDFRLARLVDHGRGSYSTDLWRHHYDRLTRRSQGDLSCLINRSFTTDSDVHSFGVVLLEIACGMYPLEYTEREDPVNFVDWVWEHYEKGTILDAADARLNGEFDVKEMETVMIVGLCCAHPDRSLIPSIRQAVNVLRSEAPLPSLPPWKPSIRQTVSVQWSSEHPLRSLPPSMPSMRQAVNVLRSEAPLPSLPPWMPVEVSSSSTPTQPSLSPPALQGQPPGLNDTGCTIV